MTSALLSDFDRLSPIQRALVDHWIIDDPDRPSTSTLDDDLVSDVKIERREGYAYDRD